ncbi:GerMN domain-containing protein [Microcoleus sp. Pol12B4]|uniref:GerMN domain-containing protein n=1 Tax=Microcoleus sp. Pol12B4 TaxID=3055395 RepID=UPI002FD618F5
MKDGQEVRRVSTAVIAGACGLALLTGGGIAWWTANRSPTPADTQPSAQTTAPPLSPSPAESPAVVIPVPPPNPVQVPQVQQTPQVQTPQVQTPNALVPKSLQPKPLPQTGVQTVQVYWVKDASGKFEGIPTKVAVKQADKPDAALQAAFNSLLAGPKDGTVSSEIPKGTKLRGLSVKNDGVYVDLSAEFTSGGGSNSMTGRLGQVIYTATSLQPNTKVWISVEGKPLELLGGEGLEVAQPSTRQSFDKNFPF